MSDLQVEIHTNVRISTCLAALDVGAYTNGVSTNLGIGDTTHTSIGLGV